MGDMDMFRGTTVLSVRRDDEVIIIADGQVSFGNTVLKGTARKIRVIDRGDDCDRVIAGFAGATADAFALFERLESKIETHSDLLRACVELAKDWRTDKFLRQLQAMLIVADIEETLVITGVGDVLKPDANVASIGSGGPYALAAAKALIGFADLSLEEVALRSMKIAAETCVYTNDEFCIEVLKKK